MKKTKTTRLKYCILLLLQLSPVYGNSIDTILAIDEIKLYDHPAWLALLHVREKSNTFNSEADNKNFFVSRSRSPRDEMLEALDALSEKVEGDKSYRCRFPARTAWLQRILDLPISEKIPKECPALNTWLASKALDRISINFASAYMESPSSLFGHTFLRTYHQSNDELLEASYNYAAETNDQNGFFDYIARGLFGGFSGIIDELPFYRRLKTYSDIEGRDIWEYPLELKKSDIELIVFHIWEIRDRTFDYYFLDENCAYRTLSILAIVKPELNLLDSFEYVTVPVDTLKVLESNRLLQSPRLWRSGSAHIRQLSALLNRDEQQLIKDIAFGNQSPDVLKNISPPHRDLIIQGAFNYLDVSINKGLIDIKKRAEITHQLIKTAAFLSEKNSLKPTKLSSLHDLELISNPLEQHDGSLIGFSMENIESDTLLGVKFSGFQHSFLDPLAGYTANSSITVLSGKILRSPSENLSLDQFTLLKIDSRQPSTILFPQTAWGFGIHRLRKKVNDTDTLTNAIYYERGKAFSLKSTTLAAMFIASVDSSNELNNDLGLEGGVKLEWFQQTTRFSWQAVYSFHHYLTGESSQRQNIELGLSFFPSRNTSLQLVAGRGGSNHLINTFSTGINFHF